MPTLTAAKKGIIDCDVHVMPYSDGQIKKYLPEKWRDRFTRTGRDIYYHPMSVNRTDAVPPSGPPGSDPAFLRKQLIDEYGIDHAILLHRPFNSPIPYADYSSALASAFNDWLAETWVGEYNADGVFKGSICVSSQDAPAAVKEIERWTKHEHFVQVLVDSGTRAPYGQSMYDPIYEICDHYGLPFAMHAGNDGIGINNQPTLGYPTHYIEWSTLHCVSYQVHLVSLLLEGVFERYPRLKVVLVEGGVSWLPSLMWRLDMQYERCYKEVPWLKRKPSEYVREHVRLTSQPLEVPDKTGHLLKVLEQMNAKDILMFASDYPHWDFDSPRTAFPKLPADLKNRIFHENARELYHL